MAKAISNLMDSLKMSADAAMDILKIFGSRTIVLSGHAVKSEQVKVGILPVQFMIGYRYERFIVSGTSIGGD